MNYYYDTEFDESSGADVKLISIGIVAQDGREYYAESSEFEEYKCNDFVKQNVLPKLGPKEKRKTRAVIAQEILEFLKGDSPRWVAYVSGYDHVVLCKIFGTMSDLPRNFPHYTWDLKQKLEEMGNPQLPEQNIKGEHNSLDDARWVKKACIYLKDRFGVVIPLNKKKKRNQ